MKVLDRVSMALPVKGEPNYTTAEMLAREVLGVLSDEEQRRFNECYEASDRSGADNDRCIQEANYSVFQEIHEDATKR